MLESLTIENFRGFEKLELTGLRRVNLIVGQNNTGKTTLLEALHAIGNPASVLSSPFRQGNPGADYRPWVPRDGHEVARIAASEASGAKRRLLVGPHDSEQLRAVGFNEGMDINDSWRVKSLVADHLTILVEPVFPRAASAIVSAVAETIRFPENEQRFVEVLRAVDGRVVDVRVDVDNSGPFVALNVGLKRRIPIWHLGQGIFRLAGFFALLASKRPELCFVDEIENGVHYSALAALWRGVADIAERLDTQVFATTHSGECLEAAHEVFESRAAEGKPYDFSVVQLYRVESGVTGRVLHERHVDAAVTSDIELR